MKHFRGFLLSSLIVIAVLVLGGDAYIAKVTDKALKATGVPTSLSSLITGRKAGSDTTASAASNDLPTLVSDMNAAIATDPAVSSSATLVDLDTGKTYNAGSNALFTAASTAKLITAVDYLHQVELGKASLTKIIDGQTAASLMTSMIEVSDNDSWASLENYLGNESPYVQSIGLTSFTGMYDNSITTNDMAKLLTQLYQGKLINNTDRTFLYNLMADTTETNLIQAALPADATVYHKYGDLNGELNDAAIVTYHGRHFVLVVYTNSTDNTLNDYDTRIALIHAITTAAFNDVTNAQSAS